MCIQILGWIRMVPVPVPYITNTCTDLKHCLLYSIRKTFKKCMAKIEEKHKKLTLPQI